MTHVATAIKAHWAEHRGGCFVARALPGAALHEPLYAVWVPRVPSPPGGRPVVLALHGSGDCGRDGRRQTLLGLGPVLPSLTPPAPALIVFPQAAPEENWLGAAQERALRALDAALVEFGGNPAAVALTGLSLGGNGAWHLALAVPDRFAALAVVCGWLEVAALPAQLREAPDPHCAAAERLRNLPTWLFHGMQDPLVPVEASRVMHAALSAVGAPVRYTEYPDVRHGAWRPAYQDAELLQWLLAPTRQQRSTLS